MSLQVWLPLNGDLHNQGLGNYQIISNNITFVNTGKIGQCANFNGTNSYIYINNFILDNSWSYGCWINTPNSDSRGWEIVIILNNTGSDADSQLAFWVHQKENRFESLANTQYNSSIPYTTYYNSWHHFFATFNGKILKTYIDGIVVNTKSITKEQYIGTNLTIGARCANATGTSFASYFQGQLNDVRVYNHCLSDKEVEEIAKGLILHYTLDDRFCESTTNLCDNLVKGGRTTIVDNVLINTGENSDTYWYIKPKEALIGGATYTVSCYLSGFSSNSTYISWGVCAQSGTNSAGSWKCYNGFNEFTFTMPSRLDGSTANIIFDDNGGTRTEIFSISQVQLEKKDHATGYAGPGGSRIATTIYDSSGYDNNGIIVGSLETTTLSPRYKYATHFDGNTTCIKIPYNDINPDRIFTVNLWFYKNALGPKNYETLFGGPVGFEMDTRAGSASTLSLYMASPRSGHVYTPLNLNEWIMITMVRDGTNEFYYVNGELKKTIEAKSMPSGQYRIGAWASDTGQNYYGEISDFRIYATALTPEQILELYHTSATIDNMGNAYARELVEI